MLTRPDSAGPDTPLEREHAPAEPGGAVTTTEVLAQPIDPERDRVRSRVFANLLGDEEAATRIGRFVVLERIGAGGMGVVFAAFDPDLDRKVAIKLLPDDRDEDRSRLVREAQAMARLNHPNVAAVYEVGTHEERVYLAMEFVRGRTLRRWLEDERPPLREILDKYVQAGRGLAAAHAAGLVHRDFKPDNALIGDDGRVRVVDFGLARREAGASLAAAASVTESPAPNEAALDSPLTRTGAVIGTPAYMAPEQLLGEASDARSDQLALCISLYEGLYGERPFAGATRMDLVANVLAGRMRDAPKDTRVPAWIRDRWRLRRVRIVIDRGCYPEPQRRLHPGGGAAGMRDRTHP